MNEQFETKHGGYLEYASQPLTDGEYAGYENHCYRLEVREMDAQFLVFNAEYSRDSETDIWREGDRSLESLHGSRMAAVQHVKGYERGERKHEPEYFVNLEPLHGEMLCYGPFGLAEARECFESTYPAFDGGSVTLTKIESTVAGVSPTLREEYETHEAKWGSALTESTTVLGRDVWDVSQDQAGLIYRHARKQYEPSFLAEIGEKDRKQLAAEFRAAIVASQLDRAMLQEGSCDWCGTGVSTIDDHQKVDGQLMCHPCHGEYFPESEMTGVNTEPPLKPRGFIGKDILATTETERSGEKQMNNELLRAGYDAQQLRIEQLEAWIEQVVARPSMSRELRLQGLELVEARSPEIRLAVERICPSRSQGLEQTLEIER